MELTSQYKRGLIKLAVLIGLLCFFIMFSNLWPRSQSSFILDEEAQCFVDNQELILTEKEYSKRYTYYVNSITDYGGYQLGLSLEELDRLFAYRKKGNKIYTINEFQNITGINVKKLDSIKDLLVFPKYRPKKKYIENHTKKKVYKKVKGNINTVTSKELYIKLKLPSIIANRIVKYRNSLGGYQSMSQLEKVYDITEEQLKMVKEKYKIKN